MSAAISYAHMNDVRRVAEYQMPESLKQKVESICGNVGEMVIAALAAGGQGVVRQGGATICETDYLAASGATFPETPMDALLDFNRRTIFADMTEADEMRRYAAIAKFFRR